MGLEKELTGHDGRSIANFILNSYDSTIWGLSNKKINKLIYFFHGISLVRFDHKLVRNYFEAWDHGPVIRVVYDAFKKFRFAPVQGLATYIDLFDNTEKVVSTERITPRECEFISRVVTTYVQYSADELEAMTHAPGSPWHHVKNLPVDDSPYQNRISDQLIREYFMQTVGEKRDLN
jgi:uncharacterized phage-associated protein